ncbi:N-acetyltransferase [Streptomyces abikoensis]|uniref:N-acetyltransferase n=1 Tax=Streptomyces abikoensis TaxID=97398 RepID=A0ABW7TG25_9ACTN
MSMVTVEPVHGRRAITSFIRLPYAIYGNDPNWVAPLERERRAFLDPHRNPFFEVGTAELFVARRGGRVVGRIAAVVDTRYTARHPGCGFFGLFECVDDHDVAEALFTTVADRLRGRGLTDMLGPVNFTTHHECGLLVEGFDRPPAVLMPYNPPYYPALLEHHGFTKAKDLWSWLLPRSADGEPPAFLCRIADQAREREGVTVRPVDPVRSSADFLRVREVFNDAWSENWGSVPMTDKEAGHFVRELGPALRPELMLVAEVRGDPAAFLLCLPDVNQALRAARGRLTTFGLPVGALRLTLASRRIDRIRATACGIRRKYRLLGLDALLYTGAYRAAHRLGYGEIESSWTLEDNHRINKAHRLLGASRIRTHRIYRRGIRTSGGAS